MKVLYEVLYDIKYYMKNINAAKRDFIKHLISCVYIKDKHFISYKRYIFSLSSLY